MSTFRNTFENVVTTTQSAVWYVVIVVGLALSSFFFLIYELLGAPSTVAIEFGERLDLMVAYIFLVDFFLGFFFNRAYKTKQEYLKFNWPDFISSIPISSEVTQFLRVLRIWRAIRVLKVALDLWSARKQISVFKNQSQDFDSSH